MTNVFQLSYEIRLSRWHRLRESLASADTYTQCIEVDKWWQAAPVVAHYLHVKDVKSWPGPWELLSDNEYCDVAKALGMCYTLYLMGVKDVEMVEARDHQGNDVVLVLANNAKYVLNYWPDTVVNNKLNDFDIISGIDIQPLLEKLN